MILNLGVIDIPYTSYDGGKKAANPKRRGKKATPTRSRSGRSVTTSQVATWLEDRYHVMEVFYESDGGIKDLLVESVKGALENLLMGAPTSENPYLSGTSEIQSRFKSWLSSGAIESMGIPGVPTQAAINRKTGASLRFKKQGKKGRSSFSPSFIDTGLYQSSFTAWVE